MKDINIKNKFSRIGISIVLFCTLMIGKSWAADPQYIKLNYLDLLAVKLWKYSDYNTGQFKEMIQAELPIYAKIFTPDIYRNYQKHNEDLDKHMNAIIHSLIGHLNNYYTGYYYVEKTVKLGKFDVNELAFPIKLPKRYPVEYNGNLPYLINNHSFVQQYYVDLKGNYNVEFSYSLEEAKEIEQNTNQNACLRVYLEPSSLKENTVPRNQYAIANFTATGLTFSLKPNQSCS